LSTFYQILEEEDNKKKNYLMLENNNLKKQLKPLMEPSKLSVNSKNQDLLSLKSPNKLMSYSELLLKLVSVANSLKSSQLWSKQAVTEPSQKPQSERSNNC